jgi:hypothetical protein
VPGLTPQARELIHILSIEKYARASEVRKRMTWNDVE